VHKMVSRNIRDRDDELVQHLNWHAKQWNWGIWFKNHKKQEMSGKRRGSKTQYIMLTQSNWIIRGRLWPNGAVAVSAKPSKSFLNTGIYMFHITQKNLIITNIFKCLHF
jgi:hypothetical protein